MALTALDRDLLKRCLAHEPGAWNDFVDRFLGLFYHVIHHTAHLRSVPLRPEDTEDLAAHILLKVVERDYQVLRQFRGRRRSGWKRSKRWPSCCGSCPPVNGRWCACITWKAGRMKKSARP